MAFYQQCITFLILWCDWIEWSEVSSCLTSAWVFATVCNFYLSTVFGYSNHLHWSYWLQTQNLYRPSQAAWTKVSCIRTSAKNNKLKSTSPSNKSCRRTFERWNYPWLYECGAGFENKMTFIGLESNSEWRMRELLGESTGCKSLKIPENPLFLCSLISSASP